jgi:hypothetical protein
VQQNQDQQRAEQRSSALNNSASSK